MAKIPDIARAKMDKAIATDENVYILITQCLQNSFFLATEDRLCLPQDVVERMLVGSSEKHPQIKVNKNNRRIFDPPDVIREGPLYKFLDGVFADNKRNNSVHVVSIRDWHHPTPSYDGERRAYGAHCEAGSWEAEPIQGYTKFLAPWTNIPNRAKPSQDLSLAEELDPTLFKAKQEQAVINDLFDAQGRLKKLEAQQNDIEKRRLTEQKEGDDALLEAIKKEIETTKKNIPRLMAKLSDDNEMPSWVRLTEDNSTTSTELDAGGHIFYKASKTKKGDKTVTANTFFHDVLSNSLFDFNPNPPIRSEKKDEEGKITGHNPSYLEVLLDYLIPDEATKARKERGRVYVVVIGVYSDIKLMTLLTALRSLYDIDSLVVSDVLTGSVSLERHLTGLDYADKVLSCEIMHSLNDLTRVLCQLSKPGEDQDSILQTLTASAPDFRLYRNYNLNKQSVLAYGDEKLLQYLDLTGKRSVDVYNQILIGNRFLLAVGMLFFMLTFILIVLKLMNAEVARNIQDGFVYTTGGLSLVSLVSLFFNGPMEKIQKNLLNLVRLRNYLETYSTVTALLRYHFTTPENLTKMYETTLAKIADGSQPADQITNNLRILEVVRQQIEIIQGASRTLSANFRDITLGDQASKSDDPPPGGSPPPPPPPPPPGGSPANQPPLINPPVAPKATQSPEPNTTSTESGGETAQMPSPGG